MNFSYDYNGKTVTITLERLGDNRYQATLDGRVITFSASVLPSGWLIQHDNQQTIAYHALYGTERMVHVHGQHYALTVADTRTKARKRAIDGGDLVAQMPGQIIDVRITENDSVSSGQVLMVMEAMKMEIRISAPRDGIVKRVLVQKGQIVERGQVLVEITEPS